VIEIILLDSKFQSKTESAKQKKFATNHLLPKIYIKSDDHIFHLPSRARFLLTACQNYLRHSPQRDVLAPTPKTANAPGWGSGPVAAGACGCPSTGPSRELRSRSFWQRSLPAGFNTGGTGPAQAAESIDDIQEVEEAR
jgi:hypothetical protein